MIEETKKPNLPTCAHCNGCAVLYHNTESKRYWVECEDRYNKSGYHNTTGRFLSEKEACEKWEKGVAYDLSVRSYVNAYSPKR